MYIKYKTPTAAEAKAMDSEVAKYRHLIAPHCLGCGVDLGSQGVAAVPWALSVDLHQKEFLRYSNGNPPKGPIHLRADVFHNLPFDTEIFDFVVSSHVIEDRPQSEWPHIIGEWIRILKHGGKLILLHPDHDKWWQYVKAGGVHNFAHAQPQPKLGDMTATLKKLGMEVLFEKYSDVYPEDYNIISVSIKP